MGEFIAAHWGEILLSLVTAGALAACKHFWSQLKNYKALIKDQEEQHLDAKIEEKTQPIVEEIEELRDYIRKTENTE